MKEKQVLSYKEATGVIQYNMTNDYMFRYILQKNKKVLKGLICAVLHLEPGDILSVDIMNPIDLADDIGGKDFILDIRVLLYQGQEYETALPVYHIGFLDFTLFPKYPEFYATYRMLNVKNHHLYSDKLTLGVVDLGRIELATEEDKAYKIDYWARLFKAKTWEDLKMLAQNNEYLEEAAESIYKANADDILIQKCRAREEAERRERTYQRDIRLLTEENASLQESNASLQESNASLQQEKTSLQQRNQELEKRIAELEAKVK